MIRLCFYIVLACFFSGTLYAQTSCLPVVKKGKWGLVKTDGSIVLSPKYNHIEYNTAGQKFIYQLKGKYGLLKQNGKVLSKPVYDDIVCFDSTWSIYKIKKSWQLYYNESLALTDTFDSVARIDSVLFVLTEMGNTTLYNSRTNLSVNTGSGKFEVFGNTLILTLKNGKLNLYDKSTLNLIVENVLRIKPEKKRYAILDLKDGMQVFNTESGKLLWERHSSITASRNQKFIARSDSSVWLYDGITDRAYVIPKLNEILSVKNGFLRYKKSGKTGVWNLERQRHVVEPVYEYVTQVDGFFFVSDFDKYGVFNQSGKMIVPIEYESVETYPTAFVVKKYGKFGLFSKDGTSIEPVEHGEIRVYSNSAKCFSKDQLILVKFNASGKVSGKKTYSNYMTLTIDQPLRPGRVFDGGGQFSNGGGDRAVPKGWFRPVLSQVNNGDTLLYRGRWGLKNKQDSVMIKPRFGTIDYDEDLGLTKGYLRKFDSINISRRDNYQSLMLPLGKESHIQVWYPPKFIIVDHLNYTTSKRSFYAVNFKDFNENVLARGMEETPVLVDKDGEIVWKDLTLFRDYQEGVLAICQGGEVEPKYWKSGVINDRTSSFFNRLGALGYSVPREQAYMEVKNGSWYFIDKTGRQLNDKPFQYVTDFKDGLAIVKLNNKWGVVDTSMQFIIQPEYDRVTRKIVEGQTFFEAGLSADDRYFYNHSTGEFLDSEITKVSDYYKGVWIYRIKGNRGWGLIDTAMNEVVEPYYDRISPFRSDYAQAVKKGRRTLIDYQGSEILPFYRSAKIEALDGGLFSVRTKKGILIVNGSADTVIVDIECRSVIEASDTYVLYLNRNKKKILLDRKKQLVYGYKYQIISASLADNLLLMKKGRKQRLFNLEQQKFLKTYADDVVALGEQSMVYQSISRKYGYMTYKRDTLSEAVFDELEPIKNGWAFSERDKYRNIVDQNGNRIFQSHQITRVRKLDENYLIYSPKGKGLMSPYAELIIPPKYSTVIPYHGMYKVVTLNGNFLLFDRNGNQLIDQSFKDIKTVSASGLVVSVDNYDYLYNGTLNKAVSFQKIEPFSSRVFRLAANYKFGMFDHEGKAIIPINYHSINVVQKQFQVRFFNVYGYYGLDGTLIFKPI